MRFWKFAIIAAFPGAPLFASKPNTIPALQVWYDSTGPFVFTDSSRIVVDAQYSQQLAAVAKTFSEDIYYQSYERQVPTARAFVPRIVTAPRASDGDIFLTINTTDTAFFAKRSYVGWKDAKEGALVQKEGYILSIGANTTIAGLNDTGVFWGTRTMLQIFRQLPAARPFTVPRGKAYDWPEYKWRAFMIDNGRKWFGVDTICHYIRDNAYVKFNFFHLHLSDFVSTSGVLAEDGQRWPLTSHPECVSSKHYTPADLAKFDSIGKKYYQNVISDFEGPGHNQGMVWKLPDSLKTEGPWGYTVLNWTRNTTWKIQGEIMDEILHYFPSSNYFHIGCDEVSNPKLTVEDWARIGLIRTGIANLDHANIFRLWMNFNDSIVRAHGKISVYWKNDADNDSATNIIKLNKGLIVDSWFGGSNVISKGYPMLNSHSRKLYVAWDTRAVCCKYNIDPGWVYSTFAVQDFHLGTLSPANDPGILGAHMCNWWDGGGPPETSNPIGKVDSMFLRDLRTLSQKLWGSPKLTTAGTYAEFLSTAIIPIDRGPGWIIPLPAVPVTGMQHSPSPAGLFPAKFFNWKVSGKRLTVSAFRSEAIWLEILNAQGRIVAVKTADGTNTIILPHAGFYLLTGHLGGLTSTGKILVSQ